MVGGQRTRPGGWRNLSLGVLFVALGIAGFLYGPQDLRWRLGAAGLFLGSFIAVALGPWSQRPATATGVLESRQSLRGLVQDLDLNGPLYVVGENAQDHHGENRLFFAGRELDPDEIPDLDPERMLFMDEGPGLAVVPPGEGLLRRQEEENARRIADASLGELETILAGLVPGERMVKNLVIRHVSGPGRVRVRYRPLGDPSLHPEIVGTQYSDAAESDDMKNTSAGGSAERPGERPGEKPLRGTEAIDVAASPVLTALLVAVSNAVGEPLEVDVLRSRDRGEVEAEVTYGP